MLTAMALISWRGHLIIYADPLLRRWVGGPEPVGRKLNDVIDACLSSGEPCQLLRPLPAHFPTTSGTGGQFVRLTSYRSHDQAPSASPRVTNTTLALDPTGRRRRPRPAALG